MFDEKQTKLFNQGYGAYLRILQRIKDYAGELGQDKEKAISAILMMTDLEIQKMLLDISSCDEEAPTEEEQIYIKSLIESSEALKEMIPGYGLFYRNMTPANYQIVKDKFDELSQDIPFALGMAIKLKKSGVDCLEEVLSDYRTIFESFSAISDYKEGKQQVRVSSWLNRFIAYAQLQGIDLSQKAVERAGFEDKNTDEVSQEILQRNAPSVSWNQNDEISELTEIEKQLFEKWSGTQQDIHAVVTAFLHRFVAGEHASTRPKTHVILLGSESHGKVLVSQLMGKILFENGLTCNSSVSIVDFADYPLGTNYIIFLSDLYRGLYQSSEIIVFDNIELADNKQLDALYQLMSRGIYHLDQRYLEKMGMLYPATGILSAQTISEIHSNDKLFVLVSSKSQTQVVDKLGQKIVDEVSDIVVLDPMGEIEIKRLVAFLCDKVITNCKRELHLIVEIDDLLKEKIASIYDIKTGAKGVEKYLRLQVYNPLLRLCLAGRYSNNQKIFLTYDNEEFWAEDDEHYGIALTEYTRSYDQFELKLVKQELDNVIGLDTVKEYVYRLENNINVQRLRKKHGLKDNSISMHMVFTGNPGTGKTTIARIIARYLKAIGVLSSGQLREVTRADLVGQYLGETALKTTAAIQSAVGGVLFIDEAYSLCRDKNDIYGIEAIDALVKGMEDNREDLIVILAGYTKEMERFITSNPGLKSRFPNIIHFDDYSENDMWRIAELTAKNKGYRISDTCFEPMIEEFERHQIKGRNDNGNGRLVRNMIENAILRQSQRVATDTTLDLELLLPEDFGFTEKKPFDLEARLSDIVGLENVKDFIRTQYKLQQANALRKKMGMQVDTSQSLNMIFAGNPGTGKTTMARLVAEMFHELGILKAGHFVETDKGGLIAEYVGHTAQKTEEVFKSALGGVLFIDEAYAITNDKSSFGQECIDTLVKLIEDYRGDTLVILAGYSKEMKAFMKSNSGLESRFPLFIEFPDYSTDELSLIGKKMIVSKGFALSSEAELDFEEEITDQTRIASENAGNGRLVRNIVERIIRKQSVRVIDDHVEANQLNVILPIDIHNPEQHKAFDLEEELSNIVGLDEVKNFVRMQYKMCIAKQKRRKAGKQVDVNQSLNMIFTGNPGTGKTTVARVIANMFKAMGLLKKGHIIETDKSGLIAQYVGQTAPKTEEVFKSALGGVLFIDEAYGITSDGSPFGQECIDTLVKLIEDYKGDIIVILAGYTKEMSDFIKANSGLESRFPLRMEFQDYSTEELFEIGKLQIIKNGFMLSPDAEAVFYEEVHTLKRHSNTNSGNGRMVRNFVEKIIREQSARIAVNDIPEDDVNVIIPSDIRDDFVRKLDYDLETELNKVIGLENVKQYFRGLSARLNIQEKRRKSGLITDETQTLHMIFEGNPGTGKTMMARTVANLLYNMGVLRTNKLIETDRSDLVAGYVGQTAIKTRQVIERALDGVLFIDEAYSLAQGGENDFGKEAIDTLVKMMDDYRDRLVVILAGYSDNMKHFMSMNPGLDSRFANIIRFSDYSTEQLMLIAKKFYKDQGYSLTDDACAELTKIFEQAKKNPTFGNGRYVRNVFEKTLNAQAMRLSGESVLDTHALIMISGDDVRAIIPELNDIEDCKGGIGFNANI